MKRFVLTLSSFLCFSIILYVILIVTVGSVRKAFFNINYKKGGYGHLFTRLKEADTITNVDILILGTSHAYRGYDPRVFQNAGLKVFNLGSSAQTPIQTEVLLNKYFKHLNPKFIIIDVYPKVLGLDGVESTLDVISNGKIDNEVIMMSLKTLNMKVINTLLYSSYRQLLALDKDFLEPFNENKDRYISGGYIETFARYKGGMIKELSHYGINDSQIQALLRIISAFKSKGVNYVIVQAPITSRLYASVDNNAQMDSLLSTYGRYFNFNKTLQLPDSLFSDDSHLNQGGVNIFNAELLRIFTKEFDSLKSKESNVGIELVKDE